MLDPASVGSLFYDHAIGSAERVLADSIERRTLSAGAIARLRDIIAEMHAHRRVALEEMMRQPFRAARNHA